MRINITDHACDRVIEYIRKIKTYPKAKKYIKSKFNKLCREETFNWYPIAVYSSWIGTHSITSKWHTFTFKTSKNSVTIITYHYWIKWVEDNKHRNRIQDKSCVYKGIEKAQRKKRLI